MKQSKYQKLIEYSAASTLSPDEHMEATDLVMDLQIEIDGKEIVVPKPDDYPWIEEELNALPESEVVAIAVKLGIKATTRHKKANTIKKILAKVE